MTVYKSNFQHSEYGFWISAEFEDNHLKLNMMDDIDGEFMDELQKGVTHEEQTQNLATYAKAEKWTEEYGDKYFGNKEQAEQFLKEMGHDVSF